MTPSLLIGLCTDRRDWLSWVIRWTTWSRYSHVVLIDGARSEIIEATHGQPVRRLPLADFLRRDNAVVRRIRHPRPEAVWSAAEGLIGRHYDDWYAAGLILRRHWQRPSDYSCVELLTTAARSTGWPLFPLDAEDGITPQDFYKISAGDE